MPSEEKEEQQKEMKHTELHAHFHSGGIEEQTSETKYPRDTINIPPEVIAAEPSRKWNADFATVFAACNNLYVIWLKCMKVLPCLFL